MKSKIKDSHKGTELVAILRQHVGKNINHARIKFIALLLEALCRMQSVSMPKLALCFGCDRSSASSHRRIELCYLAKSFVKYGLEALVSALCNNGRLYDVRRVFDFLSGS